MTTRRRRLLLFAGLAMVGAVGTALWLFRRGGAADAGEVKRDPSRRVLRREATASERDVLAWMVEPGVGPRRIAGIVIEDGKPVPGVVVELGDARVFLLGAEARRAVTDARGRFDFGEQPATSYVVLALADDRTRVYAPVDLRDPSPTPNPNEIVLELRPCARWVRGRVHDSGGRPVAGAVIDAMVNLGEPARMVGLHRVHADADGRFAICTVRDVLVSAPGFDSMWLDDEPRRDDWDVVLFPEAIVEGMVLDEADQPVPGTVVTLGDVGLGPRRRSPLRTTASRADGSYRFDGVTAGDYYVHAERADVYQKDWSWDAAVRVDPAEHVTGVVVRVGRCGRAVAGHVLEDGQPVAGARIFIGHRAITQADGSFVLRCVPLRRELLYPNETPDAPVLVEGYDVISPRTLPDETGSMDDLLVEVRSRAEISGRVRLDGAPARSAIVAVGDPAQPSWAAHGESYQAAPAADGTYRLRGLPEGTHEISALDRVSGRRSPPLRVTLARGEKRHGVDLDLSRVGVIAGRVVDAGGVAVLGVKIWLKGEGIPQAGEFRLVLPAAVSDAEGGFRIGGVGKGTYELEARQLAPAAYWPPDGRASVELASDDATVHVELRLAKRRSLTVSGLARWDDGRPVAFAEVNASFKSRSTADAEGRFLLARLEEGRHQLEARAPDGAEGELADVEAGSQNVVIVVPRVGHIEGRIEGTGERCVVTVSKVSDLDLGVPGFSLGGLDLSTKRRIVPQDGLFRVRSLPSARYKVLAECGDGGVATGWVTVEPAKTARLSLIIGAPGRVHGVARGFPRGDGVSGLQCAAGEVSATSGEHGEFTLESVFPGGEIELGCTSFGEPSRRFVTGKTSISVRPAQLTNAEVFVVSLETGPGRTPSDLGATLSLTTHDGQPALAFSDVRDAGSAAQAGIRDGDVLVAIDGVPASGARVEVAELYLRSRSAGSSIGAQVARSGQLLGVTILLQARTP